MRDGRLETVGDIVGEKTNTVDGSRLWRRLSNLPKPAVSIQSKLLVMLLAVSILSAAVIGSIGFINGRASLLQAAQDQLTTIRELRAEEMQSVFGGIQSGVKLDSRTLDASEASKAFNAGFDKIRDTQLTSSSAELLDAYYTGKFIPELEKRSGMHYEPESLFPNTEAGRYLQANYTATSTDFDETLKVSDAGDGSDWSAAHVRYHPFFSNLVSENGYEDVLLLNTTGEVVYSAYKGTDLGVNVLAPPYADSSLAKAYGHVMRTNTLDALETTDFERYLPSLNVPAAWIISPVGASGQVTGALAVQVPIDSLNAVMTGNGKWAAQGLGSTGEAYLVGEDKLMRSVSRTLMESPETYTSLAISGGASPESAQRMTDVKGTILLQEVNTSPIESALLGQQGTTVARDYLGRETLTSFAPLDIDGPRWVIVASLTVDEAFQPVDTFTRNIVLSTAGLVLLIALISLLLARSFTRPLDRLMHGVQSVATGGRDVQVDVGTRDEFARLGAAFNDMSRGLQVKADLLDAQLVENDRLLLTLMPEKVAERYKQGDTTIAEDHQEVTVLYADIVGFDEMSSDLGSHEALTLLNDIFSSFDQAAERLGVERVRSTKQGYLASCGLLTPRIDSTRRVVDFAKEIDTILRRIGAQHGIRLAIRAGIDTGRVTSGLIGTSAVVYDMWGDAVSLAYQLQGHGKESGIFLTERAAAKLPDDSHLAEPTIIRTQQGNESYWKVSTGVSNV